MNIFKYKGVLRNNQKCTECGVNNKDVDLIVTFKKEIAYFGCEKCGFMNRFSKE
ncbi:hypothetical protein [Clostridium gasigenes]|uniref:hypothetical protein n=1 Tax=Clostridium gasigenes TaxID=94869 RepID=UPI001C0A9864|nr:hypothetical protein [Clostridium gasigenes]MBU3107023.1 hypothetical protein [Clostridium gasigenes]